MRAAVLRGYRQPLRIEEVERPRASATSVLVRVKGAGVCHSDLHLWRGELEAFVPPTFPIIPGHEVSGVIEEVGDQVPPELYPGREVLVYWAYCESHDKFAARGLYHLCSFRTAAGIAYYGGGFAEYMLVPHYRYLVPADGLEDIEAAAVLSDAAVTAMSAVKKIAGRVDEDDYIAIIGLGGVGIFGLQLARLLTGAKIVAVDRNREKVRRARELVRLAPGDEMVEASGEDVRRVIMEVTGGRSLRAVLDFVGSEATVSTYLDLLSQTGTYVLVGLGSEEGPRMPLRKMVISEISVAGSFYGSPIDLYNVVDLARRGLLRYAELVEKMPLERVNEALARLERGEAPFRQVLLPAA